MKNNFTVIVLTSLSAVWISQADGQDHNYRPAPILYLPQGDVLGELTSEGHTPSTRMQVMNLGSGNPSALADIDRLALGVGYEYDTDIENAWITGIGYYRSAPSLPQSIGGIFPWKSIRFSYSVHQIYNSGTDYGEFTITKPSDNPAGYEEAGTFKLWKEERVLQHSFLLGVTISSILKSFDKLDWGVQWNVDQLNVEWGSDSTILGEGGVDLWNRKETARTNNYVIGIRYTIPFGSSADASVGSYYCSSVDFEELSPFYNSSIRIAGSMAPELHSGIRITTPSGWRISGDITEILVSKGRNVHWDLSDFVRYSGSIGTRVLEEADVYIGFVRENPRSDLDDIFSDLEHMSATYFTGGLRYTLSWWTLDLAAADSHLLSDSPRKNTLVKIGLQFQLRP